MNVKIEKLRALCQSILTDRGLDAADAHIVTDILIEAELRGRPTHGMIRLPGIADRVSQGTQSPMITEKDAPAYALIDGRDNLGYLVAHRCACTAIDKAEQSGVGVVGARDTSHSGMLGYYASMIADAGLIGLVMCNTGPRIVPWGGQQPVLGTNPIARDFPQQRARCWSIFRAPRLPMAKYWWHSKTAKKFPQDAHWGQMANRQPTPSKRVQVAHCPLANTKDTL